MADSLLRRAVSLACLPWGWAASRVRPGLRILMYHRVAPGLEGDQLTVHPDRFEQQMAWLSANCRVRSLSDALADLTAGRTKRGDVVVTFDDGYLDNLTHALPVLLYHKVPATIFVTSAFCDQALSHPRYPASAQRLHLTWDEVRHLARQPGIAIGSHTVSHPYLSRVPAAEAEAEVSNSRTLIAQQIGADVPHFCYPSGDVTPREAELVARAGYTAAVTVAPGANHRNTPPHLLHRTEMTDADTPFDLALKLSGAYDPVHALLHWRRQRKFAQAAASNRQPSRKSPA